MVNKLVKCPKCENKISVDVIPGEKTYVECPKCNTKGIITFPIENKPIKSGSYSIEVNNLVKIYNGVKAVNNVTFHVKTGEIFGFLGPNGAGKTTTMKSILNLIQINEGEIRINGHDIRKEERTAKKYIGYLPEQVAFYENLNALQNLLFYAELKDSTKEECKSLIEEFGLGESINKKVGKYSKGMVQRLGMARAVLGNPSILILDEPSGGLDPRGAVLIRDKIKNLNKKGTTIFISSHILSEIQAVCNRVGIINKGNIVAKDSVAELSKKLNLKPKLTIELEDISEKVINAVKKINGVDNVQVINKIMNIICDPNIKSKIILTIEKVGGKIINFYTTEPSLEDVFMKYTES